jgi:hypothetical protein
MTAQSLKPTEKKHAQGFMGFWVGWIKIWFDTHPADDHAFNSKKSITVESSLCICKRLFNPNLFSL